LDLVPLSGIRQILSEYLEQIAEISELVFRAIACLHSALPLTMNIQEIILGSLFCLIAHQVSAGDAIAMAYNQDGVWTAVTYNRSSTPKGGPHYRMAAEACAFALRDLRARANEDLASTKIIGESDRTGYVTVARGKAENANKDVTAIGRGKSQAEADAKALEMLTRFDVTTDEQIIYRYFSYGADLTAHRRRAVKTARR
jgi:hypothetical protein